MTATLPQTDEAVFLRAICDEPFDDLPRLVFADWLEETGHYEKALKIRRMIATGEEVLMMQVVDGTWIKIVMAGQPPSERVEFFRNGTFPETRTPIGILSRGFLSELHCTQEKFMGGECGGCGGDGQRGDESGEWAPCPDCDGSGRHGGFVNQFDRLPITTVVLTDREPEQVNSSYYWDYGVSRPNQLTPQIYSEYRDHLGHETIRHSSSKEAKNLVGAGLVNLGRKRAGLKPLGPRFDGMEFVGIDPSH